MSRSLGRQVAYVMVQSSIAVCLKSVYMMHGKVARRFGRNIHVLKVVTVGSCLRISAV